MNMFDQSHYAAIEPGDWENGAACGSCAMLTYNGHATTVMIVDECATCGSGTHHLDLSAVAYGELVNSPGCAINGGVRFGQYGWLPHCAGGWTSDLAFHPMPAGGFRQYFLNNAPGNITYEFKDGSNSGWHPIVFWDVLFPIQSVSVGTSAGGPLPA